jgi:two-component system KDP operon response regulator KdpE
MTGNPLHVLLIEDEPAIRRLLRLSLTRQNYQVIEAPTADGALAFLSQEQADLAILDLGLPDLDGLDLLRRIRATQRLPIIVLSSRTSERSKVDALELGADDYVTKPFGMEELLARMRTALRHGYAAKGEDAIFRNGPLVVDLTRRRVTVGGKEVKLSPTEFSILKLLVAHAGKVLTHRQIMEEIWGAEGDIQYLRTYVRHLRRKLDIDPTIPSCLTTESGVGYRLLVAE